MPNPKIFSLGCFLEDRNYSKIKESRLHLSIFMFENGPRDPPVLIVRRVNSAREVNSLQRQQNSAECAPLKTVTSLN